jgi:hypothetical protein
MKNSDWQIECWSDEIDKEELKIRIKKDFKYKKQHQEIEIQNQQEEELKDWKSF